MQKKPLYGIPPKKIFWRGEIGERSSSWKRKAFPQIPIQGKLVWIGEGDSLK